jgi:murein L,D-transpeptidase YcbB/YkuD
MTMTHRHTSSKTLLSLTVAAGGLALFSLTAAGQDAAQNWVRFPGQSYETGTVNPPQNRQFVREWEAQPPKGFPTLAPENLKAMRAAVGMYQDIVARGGFPQIPDVPMQFGLVSQNVQILRERLMLSGDMREPGSSAHFDQDVEKAVKRFQASNGLAPTGVVDRRTIAALNVPAQDRLKQLQVNLQRLTELSRSLPKKYVLVNIPSQQIEAVENGQIVSRHSGVVGKVDRPTPVLRSQIHQLNFNPVWHLPPTVISQDLIPKGMEMQRRGQDVLAKYGIDAYGADGRKLDTSRINWSLARAQGITYKQQPGPENPLGFVKINFHNAHSVYLHSTPSDNLFGRNFRAASSGCVRIAGIEQLAAWLLNDQGFTVERILDMKKSGERRDVSMKKPVALYMAYITAWATEDGVIQFRRDLYSKDGVSQLAGAY